MEIGDRGQREGEISHLGDAPALQVRLASTTQEDEREKGEIVRYRKQKKEKVFTKR
jgi:hypothetical protein